MEREIKSKPKPKKNEKKLARSLTDEEYNEIFNAAIYHNKYITAIKSSPCENKSPEEDEKNDNIILLTQEEYSQVFEENVLSPNETKNNLSQPENRNFEKRQPTKQEKESIPNAYESDESITESFSIVNNKSKCFDEVHIIADDSSIQSEVTPSIPPPPIKRRRLNNSPLKSKIKAVQMAKNDKSKVTSKDRLISLQKKRLEDDDGTWVQCCNSLCKKWRYLADVKEPIRVPQEWTCSMNPDENRNSCAKPEEDYQNLDFVGVKFISGSIVWARIQGYPWWPAMVEDDPDYESFFSTNGLSEVPTHYHVVFLDDNVSRAWVISADIVPFTQRNEENFKDIKDSKTKILIKKAYEKGLKAMEMSIKERLENFSFAYTWKGKWPVVNSKGSKLKSDKSKIKQKAYDKNIRKEIESEDAISIIGSDISEDKYSEIESECSHVKSSESPLINLDIKKRHLNEKLNKRKRVKLYHFKKNDDIIAKKEAFKSIQKHATLEDENALSTMENEKVRSNKITSISKDASKESPEESLQFKNSKDSLGCNKEKLLNSSKLSHKTSPFNPKKKAVNKMHDSRERKSEKVKNSISNKNSPNKPLFPKLNSVKKVIDGKKCKIKANDQDGNPSSKVNVKKTTLQNQDGTAKKSKIDPKSNVKTNSKLSIYQNEKCKNAIINNQENVANQESLEKKEKPDQILPPNPNFKSKNSQSGPKSQAYKPSFSKPTKKEKYKGPLSGNDSSKLPNIVQENPKEVEIKQCTTNVDTNSAQDFIEIETPKKTKTGSINLSELENGLEGNINKNEEEKCMTNGNNNLTQDFSETEIPKLEKHRVPPTCNNPSKLENGFEDHLKKDEIKQCTLNGDANSPKDFNEIGSNSQMNLPQTNRQNVLNGPFLNGDVKENKKNTINSGHKESPKSPINGNENTDIAILDGENKKSKTPLKLKSKKETELSGQPLFQKDTSPKAAEINRNSYNRESSPDFVLED